MFYRFHPAVHFDSAYPSQHEIRREILNLWKRYGLEKYTRFSTPVATARKNRAGKWVINDNEAQYGFFDGIICCIGVADQPKLPAFQGMEKYKGTTMHAKDFDGSGAKGKRVVVVGGAIGAVEALHTAINAGASHVDMLARSDRWIIPRNAVAEIFVASFFLGERWYTTWFPEWLLKKLFYRDLQDVLPAVGMYNRSPVVTSELFDLIREGKATLRRGDIIDMDEGGFRFNRRAKNVPRGGPGREEFIPADLTIMATGWHRPSLHFLPPDCFEDPYQPPYWYLQVFPPKHPDICAINSTYVNAIGSSGHFHIGIYTRFLLTFLMDPLTRPTEKRMKNWINSTMASARLSSGPGLHFVTYGELWYWFASVILRNPFQWKWALFAMTGNLSLMPQNIVKKERSLLFGED